LERNIAQNSNASLQALNANHVLRALVRQVPLLVTQAANRDDCALLFSQNIVRQLYKSDNKLSTEINLLILEKLCEISKRFFKEWKEWFLYDDNEVCLSIKSQEKV
jgi:CCR4-NOT transcription complex subunit 1